MHLKGADLEGAYLVSIRSQRLGWEMHLKGSCLKGAYLFQSAPSG